MSGTTDGRLATPSAQRGGVVAIVLAAGRSERMGRPKLHLPWGDTTILGTCLRTLVDAGLETIVVGRREDEMVAHTASAFGARLALAPAAGVQTPTRSLQAALAGVAALIGPVGHVALAGHVGVDERPLRPESRRPAVDVDPTHPSVLVMPGDMPLVTAATIATVLSAFAADPEAAHRVFAAARQGGRGHPVVFGAAYVPALSALAAGVRPRAVVRKAEAQGALRLVAVPDDGIFADIDDEATYERLRRGRARP